MKAHGLSFVAPRRVEISEVELPRIERGQTLVRTLYSGISTGTELLAYRGRIDPTLALDETIGALGGTFAFPFRYGYSCVGEVDRPCPGVREGMLVFAYHPHQDCFIAEPGQLIPLGDTSPRVATMLPLVETALQVSLDAEPFAHETVVVVGLGAVGLITSLLVQRAGARVLGAEPEAWRRELAESLDVRSVAPDALADAVAENTEGRGVPLLIEASGNPTALGDALDLIAHEGTVLVASWYGTESVGLPLGGAFHRRRITLRSTQVSTIPSALSGRWTVARRRAVARSLLQVLPLNRLATHDYPFEEAATAFDALDRREPGLVHAALAYR